MKVYHVYLLLCFGILNPLDPIITGMLFLHTDRDRVNASRWIIYAMVLRSNYTDTGHSLLKWSKAYPKYNKLTTNLISNASPT